jgi:predicted P-loop ATPase
MAIISLYKRANDVTSDESIALDLFLEGVKNGRWQDIVLPIRAIADKKLRDEKKKFAPAVTLSGKFKKRTDTDIEKHSGYIGIDIDNIENINSVRRLLNADKYIYSVFTSISGRGLCCIFKINPAKHRESFNGIAEYLYSHYKIIVDPTSVNQSRARFVSYDPELYLNQFAEKFTIYPTSKPPRKVENVVFIDDDFKMILDQIVSNRINLCEDYHEWLRIGFAFCHQFNEAGREYFHIVSQFSAKYDPSQCDKQYDSMIKHRASNVVTIATFYYYCKNAGINTTSPRTRTIIQAAKQGKASGLSASTVANNLKKFEDITIEPETIEKISASSIQAKDQLDEVSQMELYLRSNYSLKRNEISMLIENECKPLLEEDLNTMYLEAVKVMPKAKDNIFNKLIHSNFINKYHPIFDFINEHKHITSTGNITKIAQSISTQDPAYAEYFLTKWLVGLMAKLHGYNCPLMLIFQGPQNAGKTHFERNILPEKLNCYIGEVSPGMKDVDFYLLMSQKWIIIDDECGGKSKKDDLHQKALLDKQRFDVRKPYGKGNVTVPSLAMMCGNTNERDILTDLTGNRRYIIIDFQQYNWDLYNSVDKTDLLIECYNLYKSGYNYRLTKEDIAYLNKYDHKYTTPSSARELLQKYFAPSTEAKGTALTATDFAVYIESECKIRLSNVIIGRELNALGYTQFKDPKRGRVYYCYPLSTSQTAAQLLVGIEPKHFPDVSDELPF